MQIYFDKEEMKKYFKFDLLLFGDDPSLFDYISYTPIYIFSVILSPIFISLRCIKFRIKEAEDKAVKGVIKGDNWEGWQKQEERISRKVINNG